MKDLKRSFLAVAVALVSASALGQTNAIYAWRNIVGKPGGAGSVDGTGSAARFDFTVGIAADNADNVYVADNGNNTIRKITKDGVVTTLAGSPGWAGTNDGTGSAARFNMPAGVAVDSAGNVFVSEDGNYTIRKVTSQGVVTTFAGKAGSSGTNDGTGNAARFFRPRGLTVDNVGNIYVADSGNNTVRKITGGAVVTTLAGWPGSSGTNDGVGSGARFSNPQGVAVDSAGTLYVAEYANHTLRKVTSEGVVTTLAGWPGSNGTNDGVGSAAQSTYPRAVALDATGNMYVADYGNDTIRQVTSGGAVTTFAGSAGNSGAADGTGGAAQFRAPSGLAVDSDGKLFVADSFNYTIREVTSAGVVTTLAGLAPSRGTNDATGTAARFNYPVAVAVDGKGTVYVGDMENATIRKVTSGGEVTTLAGSAGVTGTNDGIGSMAQFSMPSGVAVDSTGNVFVADYFNNTIRKVTSDGLVTTLAGRAGVYGTANGTGSAARFHWPFAVALDYDENLIVADTDNHTIRKVTSGGVVTTLAGLGGRSGTNDGTGSAARFNAPSGVAVDSSGNIFVGDYANHTIRKVTSDGAVTTLAGSAGNPGSADGRTGAARFNLPNTVAVDSACNVYVADTGNHTIRKVTIDGVVTTIGGTAGLSGGADGIGSSANFSSPYGVAVDSNGYLYVADSSNNRISKGTPLPGMAITQSGTSVLISWPSSPTGFLLQQNTDLSSASVWQTSGYSISNDGTTKTISISSPTGNLFFRLVRN